MIDRFKRHDDGRPMTFKSGTDQLAFPKTLAGTWPASGDGSSGDTLQHVIALHTTKVALTSLGRHVSRRMRSWPPAPGIGALPGWADFRGRMDLIAMASAKLKDVLSAAVTSERRLIETMSRSRP